MKRYYYLAAVATLLTATACTNDIQQETAKSSLPVTFTANMKAGTRATETAFESGDEISVYAVQPVGTSAPLASRGNYADNVKYTYNGSNFTSSTPISLPDDNKGLAYYAVYPYAAKAGANMTFQVETDQTTHAAYTASDLCTSFHEASTSNSIDLEFSHRLSSIVVEVTGTNIASKNISVQLSRVLTTATVNLNDNQFEGTGATTSVKMGKKGNDTYEAIIPPQYISSGMELFVVTVNGVRKSLSLNNGVTYRSGNRYNYTFEVSEDNDVVIISGDINPWNYGTGITNIIPETIIDGIDDYMPIYNGDNPPMVEGAYLISPMVAVYCEDEGNGGYSPGDEVIPETIRFSNQNTTFNTLDFESYTTTSSAEGSGAFISGSGNNFTAYFSTIGESHGISTKTALVISGTKTSSGISNLYYAFVMVQKGDDPSNTLMEEGVYRIFKDEDGLSANTTWSPSSAKAFEGISGNKQLPSAFSKCATR